MNYSSRATECQVLGCARMLKFLGGVAIHLANSIACKSCRTLACSLFLVFDDSVSLKDLYTSPIDLAVYSCLTSHQWIALSVQTCPFIHVGVIAGWYCPHNITCSILEYNFGTHTHARTHTHKVYSKKINCHMLPPKYIPSFPQLPHTAQSLAVSWLANKVTLKFLQCTESCNCLLRTLRDQPGYQGQRNATTRFYRCPFSDNQVSMHYEGYTSKLYTPCV